MPLAVLGGSFDPVHYGHVGMARHVLNSGFARQILIVPAFSSPFKTGTVVSANDRLAMARLAFSSCANCRVDDREVTRGGPSYMIETLEDLHHQYPERSLRLIIGADNVTGFSRWHRFQDILDLADILVLGRFGHDDLSSSMIQVPGFDQRVSSTEIRAILAAGQPLDQLVPDEVIDYIRNKGLYR